MSTDMSSLPGGHRERSGTPVRTASTRLLPRTIPFYPARLGGFLFVLGHSLARRLRSLHLLPCSACFAFQKKKVLFLLFSRAFDVSLQHVRARTSPSSSRSPRLD